MEPTGNSLPTPAAELKAQRLADVGAGRARQDHFGILSFLPEAVRG